MNEFVRKHEDRIHGVLSCFDRMLFCGYLPIMSGWSMAQLLKAHEIDSASVEPLLLSNAERVKARAVALAREHGRPFEYLGSKLRNEDAARNVPERDGTRADAPIEPKLLTKGYYDSIHFARRLKVSGPFAFSFNDEVTPPTSTFAAYNIITAPKQLLLAPDEGHRTSAEQRARIAAWQDAQAAAGINRRAPSAQATQ